MKYLITGSLGFVGSHLMEKIDNAIGYDLKSGQDIRDKNQLSSYMKKVDAVIHLAAQTSIAHAWDDPTDYYSHNVVGTSNVIETAIKCGVKKIIYASSASIYFPLDNPYSHSKAICEDLFKIRQDKISCIALRFMNIYGKGQNPSYGTVIPSFYKGIKNGNINIYGDGENIRDYIHVDDIVKAIILATNYDKKKLEVFDIGTGFGISVKGLAKLMMKLMKKKAKITYLPKRRETDVSVAKWFNATNYLNFRHSISLEEGIKRIIKEGI